MKRIVILLMVLMILAVQLAYADKGHIKLLAVKEIGENSYEGSVADLYLEIKPGTGKVFLETFPLSKIDTQISTRFAKEIACNYIDKDCDSYDFFYIMNAESSIVGGPSAGAAVAVLTASVLNKWAINESVAITGTINSGGLIGPVGGLSEKVEGASTYNVSKVLISKGSKFVIEENMTFDLEDYGKKYNISVVEIIELNDALYFFTGHKIKEEEKELKIDEQYTNIMKMLSEELCNRSEALSKEVSKSNLKEKDIAQIKSEALNLTLKGKAKIDEGKYYSSASYCFGANTRYRELLFRSNDNNLNKFLEVQKNIDAVENQSAIVQISTITDLEAYMIVKERLEDAKNFLKKSLDNYKEGKNYSSQLAYAYERTYSAETWMFFLGKKGRKFVFNEEILMKACRDKLAEADERMQYVGIYFPEMLADTKKEISLAYKDFENKDYELCLFRASKAKAEADSVVTVIGVAEDDAKDIISNRLSVVKRIITEQKEGVFPILGYSYYEYADSLKEEDIFSALLYSEYALELSNLDIYFKEKDNNLLNKFNFRINYSFILLFISGAIIGFVIGYSVKKRGLKVKRKRK